MWIANIFFIKAIFFKTSLLSKNQTQQILENFDYISDENFQKQQNVWLNPFVAACTWFHRVLKNIEFQNNCTLLDALTLAIQYNTSIKNDFFYHIVCQKIKFHTRMPLKISQKPTCTLKIGVRTHSLQTTLKIVFGVEVGGGVVDVCVCGWVGSYYVFVFATTSPSKIKNSHPPMILIWRRWGSYYGRGVCVCVCVCVCVVLTMIYSVMYRASTRV